MRNHLKTGVGAGRGGEEDSGEIPQAHLANVIARFFDGKIGHQRSIDASVLCRVRKLFQTHAHDGVQIRKDDETHVGLAADVFRQRNYVGKARAMAQGAFAGTLDDRAVGYGIAEGNTQLNDRSSRADSREYDFASGGYIGVTAGYVGNESGAGCEVQRHVDEAAYLSNRRFSRRMPISLSPRPDTFTMTMSDFLIFGARLIASTTACADSSAGMMPSVRASRVQAASASSSEAETYSARPKSFNHACSGPMEG